MWARSKDVRTVLRLRSCVKVRKGEGREGLHGRWNRYYSPSVAFTLKPPPPPPLSINNFYISSGQTFCPLFLGSQCQWVYWTQVGARKTEDEKQEGHFLHSVCVPGGEGTDFGERVRKAVLLDWLPRLSPVYPKVSCGRGHWRAAPSGVHGCHGRAIKVQRQATPRVRGLKQKPLKYTHPHTHMRTHMYTHTLTNIHRVHTTSSSAVTCTRATAGKRSQLQGQQLFCYQTCGFWSPEDWGTATPPPHPVYPALSESSDRPAFLAPSQNTRSPQCASGAQRWDMGSVHWAQLLQLGTSVPGPPWSQTRKMALYVLALRGAHSYQSIPATIKRFAPAPSSNRVQSPDSQKLSSRRTQTVALVSILSLTTRSVIP